MTHGRPCWYDIQMRGCRLEAISRQMNTKFWNEINENPTLALSYLDRLIKLESTIWPYVNTMTGVKKFIRDKEKREEQEIAV